MIIESTDELWNQLMKPCGLPLWFGRNLNAWEDTLSGGISETLDSRSALVIRVRPVGVFAPGSERGRTFIDICQRSGRAQVELVNPN